MATRTVFVKLQPIFDTSLAKELVAIIALLGFPGHLEANLTENKPGEFFRYFEAPNRIGVIAYCS